MTVIEKGNIKIMVRGMYDLQKMRIQMGNRIVGNFKAKMGQEPGEKESTLDAEGKALLKQLRASHKKLTDGVTTFPRKKAFVGDEVISSYTELCLIEQYIAMERNEKTQKGHIEKALEDFPVWTEFMEKVRGVGPSMAGVIISEIDIQKAIYPSSLWKYAGLSVERDGRGTSKRKEHLIDAEYTDAEGEIKTKKSITFNPFLKTKLVGVLAGSFIKAGNNKYDTIYRDYKLRLENMSAHEEKTKGHRNNMAKRYMIKMFLVDLHREWRALEGLSVAVPYSEGKLDIHHRKAS